MNYSTVQLKDCVNTCIDYRGKTPKKLGGDWSSCGFRAFSAKNIKTGKIVRENTIRFLNNELYIKWMKEEISKGDILVTSEAPFGEVFYWNSSEKIVLSQRLFGLKIKETIHSKYIYYYMQTHQFKSEMDCRATGSTVRGLRQPELLKCLIKLPLIEDQKVIANILSSLDDKIELNNKINKNLEEIAQALFKQWFVDFEFPNEEGESYKSSGGEMIESELGLIPKEWEVETLDSLFKYIKGKKPRIISEEYSDGYMEYLTLDVLKGKTKLYADTKKTIIVDKLDVTMVMDGASSGSIYYGKNGILSSTLSILRIIDERFDSSFLYSVLKNIESAIKDKQTGSAIPHTDKNFVYSVKTAFDEKCMKQFSELVKSIREKVINIANENEELSKTRNTLLPKLMTGEIRVSIKE